MASKLKWRGRPVAELTKEELIEALEQVYDGVTHVVSAGYTRKRGLVREEREVV